MKIPKRINVKTALIFVVISILLTSGLFYVFAATPASTFYISSGVYPGAPSFTVWKEGSNYFAKDANGLIAYSGANISEITQNCIDALGSWGGNIHFGKGAFTFDSTVTINKHFLLIDGEGLGTQFRTDNNIIMFNVSGNYGYLTMANIRFRHYGSSGGILHALDGIFESRFVNLFMDNDHAFGVTGVAFNFAGGGGATYENFFSGCSLNFAHYLLSYVGSELTISNCKFGQCGDLSDGIVKIQSSGHINIDNTGFEVVKLWLQTVGHINLNNLWWTGAPDVAIYAYEVSNMTASNLNIKTIYNITGSATLYGIRIYSEASNKNSTDIQLSNVIVSCNETVSVGIGIGTYVMYTSLINCNTRQCAGKGISVSADLTEVYVHHSWNASTWIA